ncbi:hypothetical protein [Methylomonas lenta]|uniref:hypothetical protein n=1 Tax=Methylomonas lenta TaxID=980561 RepID=UPI0012F6482C|nr:hypothetical protein [Methylomonas lenta]
MPKHWRIVKPCVALANAEAAQKAIDSELGEYFPLVSWQTGYGTHGTINDADHCAGCPHREVGLKAS